MRTQAKRRNSINGKLRDANASMRVRCNAQRPPRHTTFNHGAQACCRVGGQSLAPKVGLCMACLFLAISAPSRGLIRQLFLRRHGLPG
ncbi:hypothetical protein F5Y01DRAFT_137924 [Xylaria sp. FL0043]|nr:hypothetical protein F5Y01DRAFT_137924 [Xylaria sp. FL0043]